MSHADQPRAGLPLPVRILLISALFVGAALLFVQLLRPFVEPGAVVPASVAAAPIVQPERLAPATGGVPQPAAPIAATPAAALPAEPAPFAPEFKGPRIAIVLTEVGDNPALARAAIQALPPAVGLALTPYPDVRALGKAARADGHEVWAGLPMQPKSWPRVSPGKNTLLIGNTPDENLRRLDWALARVEGAVGVTGIMGSAFTENAAALHPVLGELTRRGLVYIDARSSGRSVALPAARETGTRAAANDRFLDESGNVAANLAALERQAKAQGQAIGFARPLPGTIEAIEQWAPTLEAKGILLVPPSTLAK